MANIQNVNSPLNLRDFIPISLFESLYKLIAKVMAACLAPIMIQIISVNHLAFIKGRQHVDGVVEVNEIIDLSWRGGNNSLIFKVYIEGL